MDLNKIFKSITENKSVFLALVVVLAFFIAGVVLWGGISSKMVSYRNQIEQKKEKNKIIEEYGRSKKQLDEYLASLAKPLTSDALTNKIAALASQNRIEDIDIVPQPAKKFDYYIATTINLSFKVNNFKDLITFMQALDASPYVFKVQSWKAKMDDGEERGVVNCELVITSTQVKK